MTLITLAIPSTTITGVIYFLKRIKYSPRSLNHILRLPIPQIPTNRIPQPPSLEARPPSIDDDDNVFEGTGEVCVPIAFETGVDHLRAGATVDAEEDGVLGSAGVVEVGREEFHGVELW